MFTAYLTEDDEDCPVESTLATRSPSTQQQQDKLQLRFSQILRQRPSPHSISGGSSISSSSISSSPIGSNSISSSPSIGPHATVEDAPPEPSAYPSGVPCGVLTAAAIILATTGVSAVLLVSNLPSLSWF